MSPPLHLIRMNPQLAYIPYYPPERGDTEIVLMPILFKVVKVQSMTIFVWCQ